MICNEDCPEHYPLQSKPYGGDPGKTERLRRGSLTTCNDLCSTKHGRKSRFPCIPGYADSIFEARYWLGQQDTPGTEEYSTIRCLRPQFRRLGLVDSKRTGFALVLPYVHFERHDKVQRLKKLATRLERRKRWQSGSYCIRSIQKYHAKGDTEETHSSDGGSSSDEWDSSSESESDKDLDTSNGPASFSGRSGTSSSRATAGSSKSTMDIIKDDTYNTLPVHYRRTLSQFYYHSRLQRSRQVITRYFKRTWPHHHPLTLMVDQLWMLVLVDGTIITAFPSQMDGHSQEFPYFYTDLVQELLLDLRSQWRPPIETVLDLGFMVIQKSIGFLFNQRARYNKAFRFLNIYEQQLSEIAADEATWFHDLSAEVKQLPGPDDPRYELHAQRCLKNLLSLDAKTGVMRKMKRLKHIRRELSILFEIVRVQDTVLAQMTNALESREFRPEGVEGTNQDAFKSTAGLKDRRNRRVKKLESRKAALEILDQKAQGVMNELELFINRKEQYVQNLQSYFSGRLTQQSTRLANIVLILTVLTSVFAPLSFLSAFMALGITEMPRKDGDVSMPLWFASAVICKTLQPVDFHLDGYY
jgi:Mg2+ and Co2+ transporter CorA